MPPTTSLEDRYGRSQKKNIALAAWHAPLGGRAEEADLCRGQGFRRIAPSAPPRPQDRHVQGPAGAEEEGILIAPGGVADAWTPDLQRTASRCAASGERAARVPDAVQRPLRCTAEPGPKGSRV